MSAGWFQPHRSMLLPSPPKHLVTAGRMSPVERLPSVTRVCLLPERYWLQQQSSCLRILVTWNRQKRNLKNVQQAVIIVLFRMTLFQPLSAEKWTNFFDSFVHYFILSYFTLLYVNPRQIIGGFLIFAIPKIKYGKNKSDTVSRKFSVSIKNL